MSKSASSASSAAPVKIFRAAVTRTVPLSPGHFLIALKPIGLSGLQHARAGQFFMLGLPSGRICKDPLLKRPFSYLRMGAEIEFLYRVCGKATSLMCSLLPGEEMELIGPLGNSYPAPDYKNAKIPLVVAGGIGIASVFPLVEGLKGKEFHLFFGSRDSGGLLLVEELKALANKNLHLSTEDGSMGEKGTIVELLSRFLAGKDKGAFTVYACGPKAMLAEISALGLEGYISVEEKMACGFGVCLGCAVKTQTGYKRACKEGPVFDIREVVFDR